MKLNKLQNGKEGREDARFRSIDRFRTTVCVNIIRQVHNTEGSINFLIFLSRAAREISR